MSERIVWHNGKFIPEAEAKVSIYDSSLMFGDMAFEMMRTFNKQTFKLWEHLYRLFQSMKILEIEIPYSFDEMFDIHENLLLHNRNNFAEDDEIRSLINVSRGLLPIYEPMGKLEPNIMIACFPMKYVLRGTSTLYRTGVNAIVPSQKAIPEYLLDPKIKSRSRQHYLMANLEVKRQDKKAWALLLDPDGFVAEGSGSNFFIIKYGTLYTPKPINCLRGISRDYVMELARKARMEVKEVDITLYDVYEAQEAFFTCTPYSIIPCVSINGKPIGDGLVGYRTKQLTNRWVESVQCDFIKQAEAWDSANV